VEGYYIAMASLESLQVRSKKDEGKQGIIAWNFSTLMINSPIPGVLVHPKFFLYGSLLAITRLFVLGRAWISRA
jgi:hypothetical protein